MRQILGASRRAFWLPPRTHGSALVAQERTAERTAERTVAPPPTVRFVPCVPKTHGYRAFRTVRSIFSVEVEESLCLLLGTSHIVILQCCINTGVFRLSKHQKKAHSYQDFGG